MTKRSLLGACLAMPLFALAVPAMAAEPGCVPMQPASIDAQASQMIARANAMFREMAAEMNAMEAQMAAFMSAPMPNPVQLEQAMFGPGFAMPLRAGGTGAMISIAATGNGACSETITYSYPSEGGQPVVHVAQRGNACGSIHLGGPGMVHAAQPVRPHVGPRPRAIHPGPQLIEAGYSTAVRRG